MQNGITFIIWLCTNYPLLSLFISVSLYISIFPRLSLLSSSSSKGTSKKRCKWVNSCKWYPHNNLVSPSVSVCISISMYLCPSFLLSSCTKKGKRAWSGIRRCRWYPFSYLASDWIFGIPLISNCMSTSLSVSAPVFLSLSLLSVCECV